MGFLQRLFGRADVDTPTVRTVTKRDSTEVRQHIKVKVPAEQATAVQAALERWAASKGWAAMVTAERDGDAVELSLEHDESRSGAPPEIDPGDLGDELEKVISDAIKPSS